MRPWIQAAAITTCLVFRSDLAFAQGPSAVEPSVGATAPRVLVLRPPGKVCLPGSGVPWKQGDPISQDGQGDNCRAQLRSEYAQIDKRPKDQLGVFEVGATTIVASGPGTTTVAFGPQLSFGRVIPGQFTLEYSGHLGAGIGLGKTGDRYHLSAAFLGEVAVMSHFAPTAPNELDSERSSSPWCAPAASVGGRVNFVSQGQAGYLSPAVFGGSMVCAIPSQRLVFVAGPRISVEKNDRFGPALAAGFQGILQSDKTALTLEFAQVRQLQSMLQSASSVPLLDGTTARMNLGLTTKVGAHLAVGADVSINRTSVKNLATQQVLAETHAVIGANAGWAW